MLRGVRHTECTQLVGRWRVVPGVCTCGTRGAVLPHLPFTCLLFACERARASSTHDRYCGICSRVYDNDADEAQAMVCYDSYSLIPTLTVHQILILAPTLT